MMTTGAERDAVTALARRQVGPGLRSRWAGCCALAVSLGACSPDDRGPVEITVSRAWTETDEAVRLDLTTAQRFMIEEERSPSAAPANPFRWTTPEGWQEQPSTRMRAVNLTFGPEGEGECYLTALPGGGGGLAANVNRWRRQMGLDELEEEAIAALPTQSLLGAPATFVDFEGTFTPMGADEPLPGYRLLGLIQEHSGFMFFVKMTGPAELVAENESAFEAFCASLGIGRSEGGG